MCNLVHVTGEHQKIKTNEMIITKEQSERNKRTKTTDKSTVENRTNDKNTTENSTNDNKNAAENRKQDK